MFELPKQVETVIDRILWPILRPYRRFVIVACLLLLVSSAFAYYLAGFEPPVSRIGPAAFLLVNGAFHFITRGSLDRLKAKQQEMADKSAKHYIPKPK